MSLTIVLALAATLGLTACSDSDPEAADTPSDAPTAVNSAVQTDENGETVTTEARPGESAAEEEAAEEEATGNEGAGDAAAGLVVFQANCTGCHLNDGQDAGGVGPQLADNPNITGEAYVEETVTNGRGAMPAGLVSGEELTDVAAYVVSLQ